MALKSYKDSQGGVKSPTPKEVVQQTGHSETTVNDEPKKVWVFLHPEIPEGKQFNKDVVFDIDGEKVPAQVRDSMVITEDRKLADYLRTRYMMIGEYPKKDFKPIGEQVWQGK